MGYLGWSQGGVGPILTHFEFVNQLYSTDNRFDASIAIYPYCGFTFNSSYNTETPLLMITGADDDLTPEAACRNIYSKFFRNEKQIELMNNRHPLKRTGRKTDISNFIEFLLSEKSSWITGQDISIDGGMSTVKA